MEHDLQKQVKLIEKILELNTSTGLLRPTHLKYLRYALSYARRQLLNAGVV